MTSLLPDRKIAVRKTSLKSLWEFLGGLKSPREKFPATSLGIITTIVAFGSMFAPFLLASQSSISVRSAYNSTKQTTFLLKGLWGVAERTYVNGGFVYARAPLERTRALDTFYQGNLGVGHAINNVAVDGGFSLSYSPLTEIQSKGGYLGLTYIFMSERTDPAQQSDRALSLLHTQIYPSEEENTALFWARVGFTGNTMSTTLRRPPDNKAKGTAFTLDVYYPADPVVLLGAGIGFHGYDSAGRVFFAEAQKNATSLRTNLLGSTIVGLPRTSAHFDVAWTITDRDIFQPRYSSIEIDSTRLWTHTLGLGWRHQFTRSVSMTPSYETTVQGSRVYTGFLLDLTYVL